MRNFVLINFLLFSLSAFAQDGGFLKSTSFRNESNGLQIDLVIAGGNTCNGISVFHSSQPELGFYFIGKIDGICGSTDIDSRYSFVHEKPIEFDSNYYYFEFGGIGASDIKKHFYVPFALNDFVFLWANKTLQIFLKHDASTIDGVYVYDIEGNELQHASFVGNSLELTFDSIGYQALIVLIRFENSNFISKKMLLY